MVTERSLRGFWQKPIGELCAFINGATTVAELEEFGCDWWSPWATADITRRLNLPVGDLGPGSYGGAFRHYPAGRGEVDQFQQLIEQIKTFPEARTHFVTPWIPHFLDLGGKYRRRATVAPCHGWVHVRVINDKLHLHMFQRAADVPIGLPGNMVQYAALLLMLEQVTGIEASTYYHTISDAHIYVNQLQHVDAMLTRPSRKLPTVTLTSAGLGIRDIHEFRSDHFALADYFPHPPIVDIPVSR